MPKHLKNVVSNMSFSRFAPALSQDEYILDRTKKFPCPMAIKGPPFPSVSRDLFASVVLRRGVVAYHFVLGQVLRLS